MVSCFWKIGNREWRGLGATQFSASVQFLFPFTLCNLQYSRARKMRRGAKFPARETKIAMKNKITVDDQN